MSIQRKVGYRKPPEEHRFKKGTSGNPKGRPPKPKANEPTEAEILRQISDEIVIVDGREMTKMEYGLRVLQKMALKGDIRAMKLFEEKLAKAGIDGSSVVRKGVLVLPAPISEEEWCRRAEIEQAPYRERRPDD